MDRSLKLKVWRRCARFEASHIWRYEKIKRFFASAQNDDESTERFFTDAQNDGGRKKEVQNNGKSSIFQKVGRAARNFSRPHFSALP